jgi:formamidopyrimidine-DNA glycosylase
MAELPEISKIANQMDSAFKGKKISSVEIKQEKCINVPKEEFAERSTGAEITGAGYRGKWMIIRLSNNENILISLGMGGDILYYDDPSKASSEYQIRVWFSDDSGFTIKFWWFGKFLICSDKDLENEPSTKDIGMDPFDVSFSYEYFRGLFAGRKGQIKAFMLDQKNIGGIGNMYIHDILFKAKLHPQKKITDMNEEDFRSLYESVIFILRYSQSKGAFYYEGGLFGDKGTFTVEDFLVGYKEGKPCPICGTPIVQIKTGGTSSYVCTKCQTV